MNRVRSCRSGALLFAGALLILALAQYAEYGVKAAFLFNFVQFVKRPPRVPHTGAPVTIGVFGEILAGAQGSALLTVSDSEELARKGGVIGFTVEEGKVNFEVNPAAGQRAGLDIGSKLMKLGKVVSG